MSTKHTQERLVVDDSNPTLIARVVDGAYDYICEIDPHGFALSDMSDEQCVANARRLVACWNRLLPFTTEQIEDHGFDLFHESRPDFERAMGKIKKLTAQIDAAVEVIEAIEFSLRLPGVTVAEVLAENSPIREGVRAFLASAKDQQGGAR